MLRILEEKRDTSCVLKYCMYENGSKVVWTNEKFLILFIFFRYVTKSWDAAYEIGENYEGKIIDVLLLI